ncbi:D-alanyl-D-alanine carboxypeptidase family protein [Arenimonas sp.]|uniref:D-alanyl-D-alanine carboxypeptidase family protein n=1 Tax=Arenimonas sp. TaxID=1872635 RepID=UPI0035AFA0D7
MARWLIAALLCLACAAAQASAPRDAYPSVARAYWVEIDGRPTWAGQPDQPLPMASLAKLMTALLLAEHGQLDGTVVVSRGAAAATGTRLGLRAGERFRASDLFTAMLVRSANDACRALADWRGGDLATFVAMMNTRAAELGMHDTTFANACGHDAPGQASSVRDLAKLARAAMAEPLIAADAKREDFAFKSLDGRAFSVRSTNALLGQFPGAIGLKTGFTPGAGRCLIALAERDGHEVLAILLHAPDRWWDTVALLELAFDEARRTPAPGAR